MRNAVVGALVGIAVVVTALVLGPTIWAQVREGRRVTPGIDRWMLQGPGSEIGLSVRELRQEEISAAKLEQPGGVHVEEVVEWEPGRRVRLRMGEFPAPLSRLATHFDETFEFERTGGQTRVVRSFELHPKSKATRPLLWLISLLLKRAIARHLRQMKAAGTGGVS